MQVISRQTAERLGLKRYFTGEPCVHGHLAERYCNNTRCVQCFAVGQLRWKTENPDQYNESKKRNYRQSQAKAKAARSARQAAVNAERALEGLPPISTRREAKVAGEKHYYTGKPCSRGHVEVPRATSTSKCVECNRENARRNYAKNPEKQRAWQRANPGKMANYKRKWFESHPEKREEYRRKRREAYRRQRREAGFEPIEYRRRAQE